MHHPIELVRVNSLDQVKLLTALGSKTWINDPVFELFCPDRHKSPKNYHQLWRIILKDEFSQPGTVIIAACKDGSKDMRNAVGFAVWRRHGKGDIARSWRSDSLGKSKILLKADHYLWRCKSDMRRQTELSRLAAILELVYCIILGRLPLVGLIDLLLAHRNVEKLYPEERWRLSYLGVSPDSQNCGVGKTLLQWGIERSEEEEAPAVLESSKPGRALYEKMGFRVIGWQKINGGKLQHPAMLREARGHKKLV
ncbi:uncharacterized protein CTRU02_200742 [Colletotrichum truncatum]|uniref:Uncharacterized protein n=1 Tax=Colletotrichum truncatum TaxID=5467 RepID=A0ACC3ZFH8_COLTU|nr:uncharacterized protein CTRU02_00508 [Colletotrichum truncatum]KAF6801759.1 hypothetical protein CTRU02_00508 [Colletotrichum truncatum]